MQAAAPSTPLHFKVCPLYLQRIKKRVIRTSWPTEAALIPAQAAFSDSRTLDRKQKRKKKKVAPHGQETFSFVRASVRGPSSASFGQESRPWGEGPGQTVRTQSLPAMGSRVAGPWGQTKPNLPGTHSQGAEEQRPPSAPRTVLSYGKRFSPPTLRSEDSPLSRPPPHPPQRQTRTRTHTHTVRWVGRGWGLVYP